MASQTGVAADEGATVEAAPQWVVFACDAHRFAVPLERIREIIAPPGYTRLPGCGPEVCGLIALRGRIITVLDFAAASGFAPAAAHRNHALLLLEDGERLVGIAVEEVLGVTGNGPEGLALHGDVLRALDATRDDVLGIGEFEGLPFMAVDPDALIARLLH
jgi:purine-binding chemotaxis protein CheW